MHVIIRCFLGTRVNLTIAQNSGQSFQVPLICFCKQNALGLTVAIRKGPKDVCPESKPVVSVVRRLVLISSPQVDKDAWETTHGSSPNGDGNLLCRSRP